MKDRKFSLSFSSTRISTVFLVSSFVSFLISPTTEGMEATILLALFAVVFAIREHSDSVASKELQEQMNNQEKPL